MCLGDGRDHRAQQQERAAGLREQRTGETKGPSVLQNHFLNHCPTPSVHAVPNSHVPRPPAVLSYHIFMDGAGQVSLGTELSVSLGPLGRTAATDVHAGDKGVSAAFSYAHSKVRVQKREGAGWWLG